MTFNLAVPPKKRKYDCVTEDDYVCVRSKSRPLTRFCDTNYDVTMHRHTAIRAVLTTVKVLSGRGTFEGQHNGNIGVIPHESALHVIFSPLICGDSSVNDHSQNHYSSHRTRQRQDEERRQGVDLS